jgi:hypothetical protein
MACLNVDVSRHWPAATATGCLYAYGLPLRLRPASTPTVYLSHHLYHITIIIVIIIVHFLFKQNFYLSLYVIYLSVLCDSLCISSFLGFFSFFSPSNCAVEGCDFLLLLIQPCMFCYPCLFYFC